MNIIASFWFLVLVLGETTAFSFRPPLVGRTRQFQPFVSRITDTKLRNTGVEIPITEQLECTLHLMYKQSMAWSLVAVVTELIRPSLPGSPFVRHLLPLYVQAALTAKTLSAAAQRKRLDGTTFRLLNVGLLLSCIPTVMSTLPIAISFPRFVLSNEIMGAFAATVRSVHAYITMYTAYDALMLYGLPSVKLNVVGPLSGMYLALTMCHVYGFPMTGAGLMLESALTACILFALHGAAAAGQKRLSSHTYLALNGAVILSSLFKLFGLVTTYPGKFTLSVITQNVAFFALPIVSLVTAAVGLFKGVTNKDKDMTREKDKEV